MDREDKKSLIEALESIREVLTTLKDDDDLRPQYLQEHFDAVWPSVEQAFKDLKHRIDNPQPTDAERLDAAGLNGSHLKMKLTGLKKAIGALASSVLKVPVMKRILKWSNILLGSIVQALGIGEAIKELKEVAEAGLDEVSNP